jgi:hypothetical protein
MSTTRGREWSHIHVGMAAMIAVGATLLSAPAGAQVTGRYLGAYQYYNGTGTDDYMRHLLDLHDEDDLSRTLRLSLDMSLSYRARPGESETDLLQSRFFGNLRSQWWRAYAQYVPWQDAAPGVSPPRQQEIQLGFDLTPRRAPHLRLVYDRHDRANASGQSGVEDFRIEGTHSIGAVGSHLSYRRINTTVGQGAAAPSNTDEWQAGVLGAKSWGPVSGSAGYQGEYSTFESWDRSRIFYTQRVDLTGQWTPRRGLSVTGTAFTRWGRTEDNVLLGNQLIDEKYLSGGLTYFPIREIELGALREYRSSYAQIGNQVSDYMRLQAIFRKDLRRGLLLQNGYVYTVDLHSQNGSLPQNTVFFLLDGRVRRGVAMRGELRFSTDADGNGSSGTFVRRLLGIRLTPSREVRLEGTWYYNTYPAFFTRSPGDSLPPQEFEGQNEQEWEVQGGYRPSARFDLSGSYRWLEGRGRLHRDERFSALTGSYQFADRTTLSVNWNRRVSEFGVSGIDTRALSVDLAFWLPQEFRTKLTWTRNSGTQPTANWYNVTVEKHF